MLKQELESEAKSGIAPVLVPELAQELSGPLETETDVEIAVQRGSKISPRTVSRIKNKHNIILAACLSSFLFGIPACLVGWGLLPMLWPFFLILGAVLTIGGIVGIPITLISRYSSESHASAGKPMPPDTGKTAIGPLLDRMPTDVSNVAVIRERLTTLLPQITADDSQLLEHRHYKQLNLYLQRIAWQSPTVRPAERAYLLALLKAYSCVGDPKSIPHIQRIAGGRANCSVRDAAIRAAAGNCLNYLNEMAAQLGHHKTLLRSSQIVTSSGELVRPLISTPDNNPAELMRPTATDARAQERDL